MQTKQRHDYRQLLQRKLWLLLLLPAGGLGAQSFNTNGSASNLGNGCYQLTPNSSGQAGTIFSTTTVNLSQPFNLDARLNFGCKDSDGADGIVFIFATTNTAVGTGGGQMGYQGISPSVAIEMDDYQNGNFGDPASDHMAIYSQGSVDHNAASNLAGPIPIANIEDCNDHCFSVNWNPQTQQLTAKLDGNLISYTGNILNLLGGTSNVYYGFSSGTGSLSNAHTVCLGPPQLQPMDDVSICPGQSTPLQADPNGQAWQWAPNPTLSSLNSANPTASPLATTAYQVTITYACNATLTDDVTVNLLPPPPAAAGNNGPLCAGEDLVLTATGGVGYSWSGPLFFSSNQQQPTLPQADLINGGTYTVTVTDAQGCTATASTDVQVLPAPVAIIIPPVQPLCESAPPLVLEGIPSGGSWGGAASPQGLFDPSLVGPGQFPVSYTYTDANGCTDTDELELTVIPLPMANIQPTGPLCSEDPPISLNASPPGGSWGGAANSAGILVPASLGTGTFQVSYFVSSGPGCADTQFVDIDILPATTVTLGNTGPFCPQAGLQTLSADPPGGSWGGSAGVNGTLDPAVLGPGQHLVTYEVPATGQCPGLGSALVTVYAPPSASMSGGGTLCANTGASLPLTFTVNGVPPLQIEYSIDQVPQPPLLVGAGTTILPVNLGGTYTLLSVTDANGCLSPGTDSVLLTVAEAPQISNFDITCDGTNTLYTVSFDIVGGDPGSYSVTGSSGTLSGGSPFSFVSDPIPAGNPYDFLLDDANQCLPQQVSGSFSCLCSTDAGSMGSQPVTACAGESVTAVHLGDEVLDTDDTLLFILHTAAGNNAGTILSWNHTPVFQFLPPLVTGTTYYISAIAGNPDGNGLVDLTDPCLSVAFGTPVLFRALPTVHLAPDTALCAGKPVTLTFNLSGTAPFDLTYTDGNQVFSLLNILDGHGLALTAVGTASYQVLSVTDNNLPACEGIPDASATLTVWQPAASQQAVSICQGDSLPVNGNWLSAPGIYSDTLATFQGCDSISTIQLTVLPVDTTYLTDASCDPSQTGLTVVVLPNQYGCDSTVFLEISYTETDTQFVALHTCQPSEAGIYADLYTTPQGCDSLVITTVTYLPPILDTIPAFTCDPTQAGSFTETFPAASGCDSIVTTIVVLLPGSTTNLQLNTCDPSQAGTFSDTLTNQAGCDSIVIRQVTYIPGDTTLLSATTCDPAAAGIFTELLTNRYGCDSLVVETVLLLPSDSVFLTADTCDVLAVGTYTTLLQNQYGCDSLVILTVSLRPADACGVTLAISADTIPCGQNTGTLQLSVLQGLAPFSYQWQELTGGTAGSGTGNGPQLSLTGLPGGTYAVTVTAANGLTATIQTVMTQYFPPFLTVSVLSDYQGFGVSCQDAADGALSADVIGNAPPYSFFWSNGAQAAQLYDLPAGTYSVTVSGAYQCTAAMTVDLTAPPRLDISLLVRDLTCFETQEGSITAVPTGGTPPYTYRLNGGSPTDSGIFTGLSDGTYTLTVGDENGCLATEIVWINAPLPVTVELGADDYLLLGEQTVITALVNLPLDSLAGVVWSALDSSACPDCLDQAVAPLITTTYQVSVTASNGCRDSDQLTLFVDRRKQVFVPNAFSPDGNGHNDIFYIQARPGIIRTIRSFRVYSRWGESVMAHEGFSPNDPTFGWDGVHRGRLMDPQVFTWMAEIEFTDGETGLFKGDVVLMR